MKYEHPLPDDMEEPDPQAVETAAVLELVLLLFNSWSDEQIEVAIDRVGFYRHGHVTDYVNDEIKLQRRGVERAADILSGVLAIRQDHAASISGSDEPSAEPPEDDEEA